jgi:hypothetical protein
LALGYVEEDVFNLQDVGQILLDLVAPFEDFVLVACDFEALLAYGLVSLGSVGHGRGLRTLLHAHQRNIGEFDLIRRLVDSDRHIE